MTQNDDGKPGAPDTDILSAIRRIVDEEQGGAAPAAAAPAPVSGRGGAFVLTPTMRVNAPDADADDLPPLRLTKRVDAGASEDASPARSLRSAFGRDAETPEAEPLRLQPAARVDDVMPMQQVDAPEPEPEPEAMPEPVAETPAAPEAARLSGFAGQTAEAPEAAPEPIPAPAAPQPAAPAPVAAGMTREELEAMITEKLRQDLSGELGTRISANIRTLVQREVSAAVAAALAKRQP